MRPPWRSWLKEATAVSRSRRMSRRDFAETCISRYGSGKSARRNSCSILLDLTLALFSGPNPVPVKFALSLLGIMSPRVRLPLVELDEHAKPILAAVLNNVKVHCQCDIVGDRAAGSSLVGVDGRNQSSSGARFTLKAIGNTTPAPGTSSADLLRVKRGRTTPRTQLWAGASLGMHTTCRTGLNDIEPSLWHQFLEIENPRPETVAGNRRAIAQTQEKHPSETRRSLANWPESRGYFCVPNTSRRDRTDWLGRQDSNLRMLQSDCAA
jgi:hypothetical protein